MNYSLIILVLVIQLCKLNLILSFTHSSTFVSFNRLFSGSENVESVKPINSNNSKKVSSGQNSNAHNEDNLNYPGNKQVAESTLTDLNKHVKIVESFINKVTHIWKHPELKGEIQKVLNSFNLESSKHGSKTILESQPNGLADYNNLEKKLQVLIIKEYDKVQKDLSELDVLFHDVEKIDIFTEIEEKCINQPTEDQCSEKPSITSLIINKLKQKSRQINSSLTRLCNKYLFSSRIIKFIIKTLFPLFKSNIGVKHVNINDILHFYDLPLDENFSLGNIQIYRHSFPSSRKDSWRLTFLGTGSRRVTTTRAASSVAFEPKGRDGPIWLFDCGEGTRLNLLKHGFAPSRVEKIFLTHLHGDHSLGVFSFINDISKWGKVEIYGPDGIGNMINLVHSTISRCFTHKCLIRELSDVAYNPPTIDVNKNPQSLYNPNTDNSITLDKGVTRESNSLDKNITRENDLRYNILESHNIRLTAVPIRHNLPTVGYVLEEIDVLGGKAPRSICFLQDTCDATLVNKFVKSPDVIIHESTYSTVSISGTKKYISKRDLRLMDNIVAGENARSCYDAASALAMDFAISKRTGALKKIPSDLVRQMNEMKENQTLFTHGINSKNVNFNLKCHLVLLYNLKRRLALFENIMAAASNIASSLDNLRYFMTFQNEKNKNLPCSPSLLKFWQDAIKPQINQSKITRASIKGYSDNKFQDIIEDIVWIYGHSTETMAGRLAGMLKAKMLILTHFSSRLPGDDNLESILTMKRIETNARNEMEFAKKNLSLDENGNVITNCDNTFKNSKNYSKVIAAWDGFYIDIPPH